MAKSTADLSALVAAGAGVVIDAERYSTADLVAIAGSAAAGVRLHIKNVSFKSRADLQAIAAAATGSVVFDFT